MKKQPLVSVVIPTYNRPFFLKRCINSVLRQTYTNIEIIVVDDNNPNTEERIETEKTMRFYANNSKVTYIKHECNKKGSAARNTGWKHSSGKYITFIDDDDLIATTKIEKQVKCLEELDDSWGACYTGFVLVKPNGKKQVSNEKRSGYCYVDALMRTLFMGSGSNLFLRKKVVDEIQGYDESFIRNQDVEFMARALEKYKLAYIDERLLMIIQDSSRAYKSFETLDGYATYYLEKFEGRINQLSIKDRMRVISVISLERFRLALYKKRIDKGINILITNKVKITYVINFIGYLVKRIITNQSYGFYL